MTGKSKYKVVLRWNLKHTTCPVKKKRCTLVVWAHSMIEAELEAHLAAPWGTVEGNHSPWTTHEIWLKVG